MNQKAICVLFLLAITLGCKGNPQPGVPADSVGSETTETESVVTAQAADTEIVETEVDNNDQGTEKEYAETKVAENEWYRLYETRVEGDRSFFRAEFIKRDAQLGIAIMLDIAEVANSRGYKFFTKGDDRLTRFYHERPSDSDDVCEVDMLMILVNARKDSLSIEY